MGLMSGFLTGAGKGISEAASQAQSFYSAQALAQQRDAADQAKEARIEAFAKDRELRVAEMNSRLRISEASQIDNTRAARQAAIGEKADAAGRAPGYDYATDTAREMTPIERANARAESFMRSGLISEGLRERANSDALNLEREKRLLPPELAKTLSPEESELKKAETNLKKAQAEYYLGAKTELDRSRVAGTGKADAESRKITAALNRDANLAANVVGRELRGAKDTDGNAIYDRTQILKLEGYAAAMVRNGHDPQSAASVVGSLSEGLLTNSKISEMVAKEEKSKYFKTIGMLEPGPTGHVKIGDKTMPIEEWRKKRSTEIRAANNADIESEAGRLGIKSGSRQQYPDGTILEDDSGKKFEVRDGQPVAIGGNSKKNIDMSGTGPDTDAMARGLINQQGIPTDRAISPAPNVNPYYDSKGKLIPSAKQTEGGESILNKNIIPAVESVRQSAISTVASGFENVGAATAKSAIDWMKGRIADSNRRGGAPLTGVEKVQAKRMGLEIN